MTRLDCTAAVKEQLEGQGSNLNLRGIAPSLDFSMLVQLLAPIPSRVGISGKLTL